jgi:hypothetical protein
VSEENKVAGLRKTWTHAKKLGEAAFKQQPVDRERVLNAHVEGLSPFPLKFDKNLGPTLDSLEKARAANKAGVNKYSDAAKSVMAVYGKQVDGSKDLGKPAKQLLLQTFTEFPQYQVNSE